MSTTPPRRGRVPYRIILASIWLTIASLAGLGLLYQLRDLVFRLIIAVFIALVLNPIVLRMQRIGFSRGPAILAATAAFFLLFLGIGAAVAAPITRQGVSFARRAPGYLRLAQEGQGPVGTFAKKFHLQKQLRKAVPAIDRYLSKLPPQIFGLLRSAASTAFTLAIVVILALFMLIEGPALLAAFMAGVPPGHRESVAAVGQTAARVVSGYTIGVLALAVLNGIVTAIALALTGVPFVSSLAVWAALVDVLPIVGGLIAIIPAGLFAFVHSVPAGIIVVAAMFGYQQVKNHILYPLAVGRAVQLNALLVLVAVLAGATLKGIAGALVAIPIAGTLHAIIVEFAPGPVRVFLRHPELSGSPAAKAGKVKGEAAGATAAAATDAATDAAATDVGTDTAATGAGTGEEGATTPESPETREDQRRRPRRRRRRKGSGRG